MNDSPAIKQNSNGIYMLEGEQLWDSDILPVCLEHIKEGDTVIDAGAWIGGHTMAYAKKVGEEGVVFSFEPNPAAFQCLKKNTDQLPNVHCCNTALGDKNILLPFKVEKGWLDSGHISEDNPWVEVRMEPLDHCLIEPNFIKIDVEGCELKVLKGAQKTINAHHPIMVLEINEPSLERQGNTGQEVVDWLMAHQYQWDFIEKVVTPDTKIYNILALPK